jgi:hypothetical protein
VPLTAIHVGHRRAFRRVVCAACAREAALRHATANLLQEQTDNAKKQKAPFHDAVLRT